MLESQVEFYKILSRSEMPFKWVRDRALLTHFCENFQFVMLNCF